MIEIGSAILQFKPISQMIVPPSGIIKHYKDYWWIVTPDKLELVYYVTKTKYKEHLSPQCNTNKTVVEHFEKNMYPWAEILQIPSVFEPVNISDYT